jgi:hypothetical protein
MDFQNQYDGVTSGIDTVITTQLSSSIQWANIPGSLVKSSSSAAGYAWGYNSLNDVFVCQLPCTGNWAQVDTSSWNLSSVLDLTTDSSNVYVLISTTDGKTVLYSNSATNTGTWNMVPVPFSATAIFPTHTYIWAQDASNNKQKCPKPCTTSNWMAVSENKVKITSSSDSSLYGVDVSGNAMKTDENIQSGWTSISGLSGLKLATVIGQSDKTGLYGVDTSSKAYRCEGDCTIPKEVDPLDTGGYAPLNMTSDPSGKSLWMTSTTSGEVGNIFNRVDKADYTTIMNNINPLDQTRDKIVTQVTDQYNQQTNLMVANKQITDVVNFFTKFFKFDKQSVDQDASNISAYRDKVVSSQAQLDKLTSTQPLLQKLLILLGTVLVVYMFGSILGGFVHMIALVILVGGMAHIIYSSG